MSAEMRSGATPPYGLPQGMRNAHAAWPLARESMRIDDPARFDLNAPTNVYYLAQYIYQLSITAVAMDEHELGLLLPRSGRVWFNVRLFNGPPRGRDLAHRDAWWRVVDASPAVRFLLGWCVSVYRVAQFDRFPQSALPGRARALYFSSPIDEPSQLRMQFWSDIARDVTELFAPASRVWRQLQAFTPMSEGDRRWEARLTLAGYNPEETVSYLADQNNCPASLIRRALTGNQPLGSYDDYLRFTEDILNDLPRLRMQRVIAMQHAGISPTRIGSSAQDGSQPRLRRIHLSRQSLWPPSIEDPRQEVLFWQLHL
jgi:hypothetical protein